MAKIRHSEALRESGVRLKMSGQSGFSLPGRKHRQQSGNRARGKSAKGRDMGTAI